MAHPATVVMIQAASSIPGETPPVATLVPVMLAQPVTEYVILDVKYPSGQVVSAAVNQAGLSNVTEAKLTGDRKFESVMHLFYEFR